jgi:hypothetical protein
LPFFNRPVAAVLAAMTIAALLWPAAAWIASLLSAKRLPKAGAA